ncbi:Superoxide dismutase [Cu-Zn] [Bulinus truncatus]|nr:Superoxide dismutase [Cu-Zn] [Bulinus truncatus]
MRTDWIISWIFTTVIIGAALCQGARNAVCHVKPDPGSKQPVTGIIVFNQTDSLSPLKITITLNGFNQLSQDSPASKSLHGFHVHEFGDVTSGCTAAGGHYNPTNRTHGDIGDRNRHVGDFGNIKQEVDGTISGLIINDKIASLFGSCTILGRAIVVHADPDDLGKGGNPSSLVNGNAGARLACCPIVVSP